MNNRFYIQSHCRIKNNQISLNRSQVFKSDAEGFSEFIKSAYKTLDTKYAKFFKMDKLSKLAFIAADVLLKNENIDLEKENDIAIVLSNKASSIDTDRKHQNAIRCCS